MKIKLACRRAGIAALGFILAILAALLILALLAAAVFAIWKLLSDLDNAIRRHRGGNNSMAPALVQVITEAAQPDPSWPVGGTNGIAWSTNLVDWHPFTNYDGTLSQNFDDCALPFDEMPQACFFRAVRF